MHRKRPFTLCRVAAFLHARVSARSALIWALMRRTYLTVHEEALETTVAGIPAFKRRRIKMWALPCVGMGAGIGNLNSPAKGSNSSIIRHLLPAIVENYPQGRRIARL